MAGRDQRANELRHQDSGLMEHFTSTYSRLFTWMGTGYRVRSHKYGASVRSTLVPLSLPYLASSPDGISDGSSSGKWAAPPSDPEFWVLTRKSTGVWMSPDSSNLSSYVRPASSGARSELYRRPEPLDWYPCVVPCDLQRLKPRSQQHVMYVPAPADSLTSCSIDQPGCSGDWWFVS